MSLPRTFSTKAFSKNRRKRFPKILTSLSDSENFESTSLIKKNIGKCCPPAIPKCSLPTIPKFNLPTIPKEFVQYVLATPVAVVDGVGFAVLTFAQLLTMLYSMQLMEQNPEKLEEFKTLAPLLIMPILGAIGVTSLNICENKEFVEDHFIPTHDEIPTLKEQLEKVKNFLRNHPGSALTLISGGAAEGIIVQSNVGYLTNQFGVHFEESNVYNPSIVLCSIIGAQFVILNAHHLVELVEKGYTIDLDYTYAIRNRFLRVLSQILVNALPITSAGIMFLLAASETYELAQFRLAQLQPEDIANEEAIGPALVLALIAFYCHLGLYGRNYKLFLANKICDISEQGFKRYFVNLFTPTQANWAYITKVILFLSGGIAIAATNGVIGFGAIDEAAYIFKYGKPPAGPLDPYQTPEFLSFYFKLFVFGLLAANFALETYATEVRSLFKLARIDKDLRERAENQPVVAIGVDKSKHIYTIEDLGTDLLRFTFIAGTKFASDWFYIPNDVTPKQIGWDTSVYSAVLSGLATVTVLLGARVADSIKDHKDKQSAEQEIKLASSHPRIYLLLKLLTIYGLSVSATISTELLLRNVIFPSTKGEEENRLDNAQLIAAAAGSLTTVVSMHAWNWVSNKVSNASQTMFSFFKRPSNANPSINNNDNIPEVTPSKPITVPDLPGEKSNLLLFPKKKLKKTDEYRRARSLESSSTHDYGSLTNFKIFTKYGIN